MRCIEPPTPLEPPVARPISSAKPVSGVHAQRQRLAVAAVGVGLDVARAHRRDGPDRYSLLALAQVGRALDQAGHEQLLDLLLEQADRSTSGGTSRPAGLPAAVAVIVRLPSPGDGGPARVLVVRGRSGFVVRAPVRFVVGGRERSLAPDPVSAR